MSEITDSQLENKRFAINPDSISGFKGIRGEFNQLQKTYPWLSGMGFFGSRTKGLERKDSDFDVYVFYDGSKTQFPVGTPAWTEITKRINDKVNGKLDTSTINGFGLVDISPSQTEADIEEFVEVAKKLPDENDRGLIFEAAETPRIHHLYSRFFLATGDGIYENRKYILEKLKTSGEGDKYFKKLMGFLQTFERSQGFTQKYRTPNYTHYPQTIDLAEKYYLPRVP